MVNFMYTKYYYILGYQPILSMWYRGYSGAINIVWLLIKSNFVTAIKSIYKQFKWKSIKLCWAVGIKISVKKF